MPLSLLIAALISPLTYVTPGAQDDGSLARGLDAVAPRHAKADLEFLADEDLGGRETPGPGLEVAANYIAARLQRLGLEPAGTDGWRTPFPLWSRRLDLEASRASMGAGSDAVQLVFARDYYPERLGHLRQWRAEGPVVSVGAGADEDVEGLDLDGCWALILESSKSVRRAQLRALEAGAMGVLVTPGPEYGKPDYQTRFEPVARTMTRGLVSDRQVPIPDKSTPVVMLTSETARRLYTQSPRQWDGEHPPAGTRLEVRFEDTRALADPAASAANLCALIRGEEPTLANEALLVCAHYDHVGVARGATYPGADDNASGVAALLAVAEGLAARGPARRSVVLLFLAGKEKGFWGSEAWCRSPGLPLGMRPVAAINLDMVGRLEGEVLYATPGPGHESFNPVANAAVTAASGENLVLAALDERWSRTDQSVFSRRLGLPVVCFTNREGDDYHRPTDTADKVDPNSIARVARVTLRLLESLQGELLGIEAGISVTDGGAQFPEMEEAVGFAAELVDAIERGELEFFASALDTRALLRTALEGEPTPVNPGEGPWLTTATGTDHLLRRAVNICAEGGQYSALRIDNTPARSGRPRRCELLLRLAHETDFDYHRMLLVKDSTGAVRVVDMWALSAGEWVSERLRRFHRILVAHPESLLDLSEGRAPRSLAPLEVLQANYDDPDLPAGLAVLERLPRELAAGLDYQRFSMLYTWGPRRAAWLEERAIFESAFPEAVGPVLWAVCDTHGWDPEPGEIPEAVGALEAITGDSTYPAFLRGLHSVFEEDHVGALPHFQLALGLEPDFQETWWAILGVHRKLSDWEAFATHLDAMAAYFELPISPDDLAKDKDLEQFFESDAYQRWKERNK